MLLPRARPPVDFPNRPITLRVTIRKLQFPVVLVLIERDTAGKTRYAYSVPERGEQIVMITDPSEQTVSHFEGEKLIHSDRIDIKIGIPRMHEWTYAEIDTVQTTEKRLILGLLCTKVLLQDFISGAPQGECWIDFENGIVALDSNPNGWTWELTAVNSTQAKPRYIIHNE